MGDLAASGEDYFERDALRAALRDTQIKLAKAKAKNADFVEAARRAAHDAYLALGRPEPVPAPKPDRRKRVEAALWHLTDWQNGKVTKSYNMAVMDARVRAYVQKALKITEIQRADHPVKHCTILLGGDMVEGTTIFPKQAWEVQANTFTQTWFAANTLEAVVRAALGSYETVAVIGEPGNHGRQGRKGDETPRGDNWDRVLYQVVADRFAGEPRLTWSSEDHWHQRFEIGKFRGVLVHGDEFRGFGGNTPMYGIIKKVNAWASGVLPPFDACYVGHFHNHNDLALSAGGSVYMTGSTESDNEYAREFVAASAVPSQRLHFVDPDKGRVTAAYKIELDAAA